RARVPALRGAPRLRVSGKHRAAHQAERLTKILDDHGLEALVATREANVAYITDFRGIEHAVFETPQLAVFSRSGTGLAVAAVEIASAVEERIDVDHLACFDDFPAVYA